MTAIAAADDEPTSMTLVQWHRPDGAVVAAGEPICLVETDKASVDMVAPAAGVLRHLARAGDRVTAAAEFVRVDPLP